MQESGYIKGEIKEDIKEEIKEEIKGRTSTRARSARSHAIYRTGDGFHKDARPRGDR
jgi:hypothetical protein